MAEATEKTQWTRPSGLTRRGLGVLVGAVLLINLPVLHYFLLRGSPEADVGLPYQDDFADPGTVGRRYSSSGGLWRVVGGELLSPGVKHNPLWLKAKLPQSVAIEFDARSTYGSPDIRFYVFGNGTDRTSGYVFIHGAYNNASSIIGRRGDDVPLLPTVLARKGPFGEATQARVERPGGATLGQRYHYRIERRGPKLSWFVDGQPFLEFDDPAPLSGSRHDRFGFDSWESQTFFDNLKIEALDAAAPAYRPPPSAPAPTQAPSASEFTDDFSRAELGPDYLATGPEAAKLVDGALVVELLHNRPVWLRRPLPSDGVVEFDAWTDDERGDLKVEAWGDGRSYYSGDLRAQYTATGYVFIMGGWKNTASVIARQWEHAPGQPTRADFKVVPGKRYHWKIVRRGGQLEWSVDGQPFLKATDNNPLSGPDHSYLGFSGWETKVHFDNVKVSPL